MTSAVLASLLAALAVGLLAAPRTAAAARVARLARRGPSPEQRTASAGRRVSGVGRRRRAPALERDRAVEACAALSGELRAGRSPTAALGAAADVAVGPTGRVLRAAAAAAGVGSDPSGRLAEQASGTACPELLRGLAACWSVCASRGVGLAAAVERLEIAERDLQDRRRAVAVELAGPRATARLLAVLPALGVLLATALGAAPLSFLVGTAFGRACLVLGVGLDVAGMVWTARLVRRAIGS